MEEDAGPAAEPSPEMVTMAPSVGASETVSARDIVMVLLLPGSDSSQGASACISSGHAATQLVP